MKALSMLMILAMVAGCATRSPVPLTPTSGDAITPAKAKLIAEEVVRQREHWRRVDSDAREVSAAGKFSLPEGHTAPMTRW